MRLDELRRERERDQATFNRHNMAELDPTISTTATVRYKEKETWMGIEIMKGCFEYKPKDGIKHQLSFYGSG